MVCSEDSALWISSLVLSYQSAYPIFSHFKTINGISHTKKAKTLLYLPTHMLVNQRTLKLKSGCETPSILKRKRNVAFLFAIPQDHKNR